MLSCDVETWTAGKVRTCKRYRLIVEVCNTDVMSLAGSLVPKARYVETSRWAVEWCEANPSFT